MQANNIKLRFLGSAQDAGVPQANCYCANCRRAHADHTFRHYAASLAIITDDSTWHMIDATPDFREQLYSMQKAYPKAGIMNSIILTHAHAGHYPGLLFLGKEGMSTSELPVYASERMSQLLAKDAPWSQLVGLKNIVTKTIYGDKAQELGDHIRFTPVEVPHRNEYSETFGFLIEGPSKKALYIPDIDSWEEWNHDIEEIAKTVDFVIVDATFYSKQEVAGVGRDISQIPHPPIIETMDSLQNVVDTVGTKVYLTHLNHSNPVLDPDSEEYQSVRTRGFFLAEEGLELEL
ncbi:MBL fold metallo-hydrolase [Terribacillus saccharophilus]|uniref:MBL fold metallo-hydrolase n=1 Tax=Terribacillus saccharophilus TaxID=361277 RepID=UPI003D2B9C3F